MGNSQGKEARTASPTQPHGVEVRSGDAPSSPGRPGSASRWLTGSLSPSADDSQPSRGSRRPGRHDGTLFGIGAHRDPDPADPMARRETRAEREARKLVKERELRDKVRERSVKEEGVDGGFLVTLGVYTGAEDFSKPTVRQLQLERRLAPFWRGLSDFNDLWTEHQIVAAARGLPIPPPDATPPEESKEAVPSSPAINITNLTVPISSRSPSFTSEHSNLTPSHPAFSLPSPPSPFGSPPSSASAAFFRGRAKTLATLSNTSRNPSQQDMSPQEIQLPRDPHVNGQLLELFLYKDALDCPICFMYYPPYLNKTRCCDQLICSECFVQIKRPEPHPPEHGESSGAAASQPEQQEPQEVSQDYMLVSEPATCPFCKTPEFGITYEAPPFRRGLAHAHSAQCHPLASAMSAMSSSSSLNSQGPNGHSRRRTISIGANEPSVVTTDKIRPDWAKKLSDARAHALRRAAAATALHNAAYVLGNAENGGRFALGRRRRTIFTTDSQGNGGPDLGTVGALLAAADRHGAQGSSGEDQSNAGSQDLFPGRFSSRRNRLEDLEELMMMEAIRLSLAAEEERKRKEDKETEKQKKKDDKQKAKDQKKADKAAKKGGVLYPAGSNASNFSQQTTESASATTGKGKAVDRSAISDDPDAAGSATSPLSLQELGAVSAPAETSPKEDPQRHLEASRAQIGFQGAEPSQLPASPAGNQPYHRHALRQLSNASSAASSFVEPANPESPVNVVSSLEHSPSASGLDIAEDGAGYALDAETPGGGAGTEPMLNFRSLAAVIGKENTDDPVVDNMQAPEQLPADNTQPLEQLPASLPSEDVAEQSTTIAEQSTTIAEQSTTIAESNKMLEDSALTLQADQDETFAGNGVLSASNATFNKAMPLLPAAELTPPTPTAFESKHYGEVSVLEGPIHEHGDVENHR